MVGSSVIVYSMIGLLSLISSVFYFLSSISLLRLYLEVGGEFLARLSLGFALLSISQVSIVLSIIVDNASISYALYTTTPALAISGIYMIWSSRRPTSIYTLTLLILVPSALDLVAFTLALLAIIGFRGHVRIGFTLIALAHLGRAIGTLMLPGLAPALLLIISEALRALGALYMAVWYSKRVIY